MDSIINYVWMSPKPTKPASIPSDLFFNIQNNAHRYPQARFCLWVDDIKAQDGYVRPENLDVYNLNEIPGFSQIPCMSAVQPASIWARVDTARLVVLRHVLNTQKSDVAVYTDLDVVDVSIDMPELNERLQKYGVAFTGTKNPLTGKLTWHFENSFMAFKKSKINLLDFIIAHSVSTESTSRNSIFNAMGNALDGACMYADPSLSIPKDWRTKIASLPIAYATGCHDGKRGKAERMPSAPNGFLSRLRLHAYRK